MFHLRYPEAMFESDICSALFQRKPASELDSGSNRSFGSTAYISSNARVVPMHSFSLEVVGI